MGDKGDRQKYCVFLELKSLKVMIAMKFTFSHKNNVLIASWVPNKFHGQCQESKERALINHILIQKHLFIWQMDAVSVMVFIFNSSNVMNIINS